MKFKIPFFVVLAIIFGACDSTKTLVNDDSYTEFRQLDTLTISASKSDPVFELPIYNPSHPRSHDLLHTSLDVRFDWAKQHLLGKATLKLKPYFYPTNQLELDAKGFEIHKIQMVGKNSSKDLLYKYDGTKLNISLGKTYEADEEYTVFIDYTAKPNELEAGGSAAITSDKGLYFVNPLGDEAEKPMQIWTQGETEASSCWFPTIDKPNERCTQDVKITIEDKFKTLSNGTLKSSKKNADGTRTDHYAMDQPHAPYLFMMSIGEYAVVSEKWQDVLVEYYVEPDYKSVAKDIFSNTPEMLDFFSEKFAYKYPWPKLSQVVVRDYVSGAMENTTGVIYGEFVQKTDRELIDSHNERIIAHEIAHHWFGDLVTCESWANLPLNESFANYSEYMWIEHKYGADAAEHHRMGEVQGYLSQARGGVHDLIYYDYPDKEETFDAHSYNKGGAILYMLRKHIGDDAFYASLNRYLMDNEYSDVEAHEFRLAVEETTGKDMNWFFNQWFFSAGHPILEVSKAYDDASKMVTVTVKQKQDPEMSIPIFQLPLAVEIHADGGVQRHDVFVNQRKQEFKYRVNSEPDWVSFDADRILVGEIKMLGKEKEEYIYQYQNSKQFIDRYEAIQYLASADGDDAKEVIEEALDDKFWVLKRLALRSINDVNDDTVEKLAINDPDSRVRAAALGALGKTKDRKYIPAIVQAVDNEKAYRCISAALKALNAIDPTSAIGYASKLENEQNSAIIGTIGEIYATSGDIKYLAFFENSLNKVSGFSAMSFYNNYVNLLKNGDEAMKTEAVQKLKAVSVNLQSNAFRRYSATKGIFDLKNDYIKMAKETSDEAEKSAYSQKAADLAVIIEDIIANETSDRLKRFYSGF